MAQRKQIRLGTMRLWVRSLALLSGLRIQRCRELWCVLQMQLGSRCRLAATAAGLHHSHSNCQIRAVFNLHHSSWQRQILNPLSEARDQTHVLMDSSGIH